MPRRIPQRRRGKGNTTYRANSHNFKAKSAYKSYDDLEKESFCEGQIIELLTDPVRRAPLMTVLFDEQVIRVPAPLGIMVGEKIQCGVKAPVKPGNCLPLKAIPEGTIISNIELTPGDGGKFIRTAGAKARLFSKEGKKIIIKLSSGAKKILNPACRATIGVIAGGGHKNKPLIKAGNSYYKKKAQGGKRWPLVSATAKNALEHPHGGKQHRKRKSKTVSRHAPPGAKVGTIASRRTGKGGKKRKR